MKFSARIVHLPQVSNWNNGTSSLIIRNPGSTFITATIDYYNSNGNPVVSPVSVGIGSNAIAIKTPPANFAGPVAIVANGNILVMAESTAPAAAVSYAGNPAPATTAYLPTLIVRNDRRAYVYVQNTSAMMATVTLYFYDRNGNLVHTRTVTPNSRGQVALYLNDIAEVYNGFAQTNGTGALYATTTNGALIAVSAQIDYTNVNAAYAYAAPAAGDTTLWTPGVFRRVSGGAWQLYSAVNVQNLANAAATIHVQFIDRNANVTYEFDQNIPARSTVAYNTREICVLSSAIWQ
jgi:hypothetical protein